MARPTKPLIVHDAVVRAALALIDELGLEAFSLDALAARIGVRAPSLYHHFSGKTEILENVARLVTYEAAIPAIPEVDQWQDYFISISVGFRRAVLRHPNAAPLLLQYFPRDKGHAMRAYERGAALLQRVGLPVDMHAMIIEGLDQLAFGSAVLAASQTIAGNRELFPSVDPEKYPNVDRAVEENRWRDSEELFKQTVRSFLAGCSALALLSHRTGSKLL